MPEKVQMTNMVPMDTLLGTPGLEIRLNRAFIPEFRRNCKTSLYLHKLTFDQAEVRFYGLLALDDGKLFDDKHRCIYSGTFLYSRDGD